MPARTARDANTWLCRRGGPTRLRWAGVVIGLVGVCFVAMVLR